MSHIDMQAPIEIADEERLRLTEYRTALTRMAESVMSQGDAVQADKLRELNDKLGSGRLTVAFCGHFSAGKSTLVNALCGAELLPSSPIPTSANVVTIVNGEPFAETVFHEASGEAHAARRIGVEELHGYAVDGEGVSTIRVSYPIPLLGEQLALVDTPGVDSTDGSHRAATESALHLADVVFYVTDYNHVQSEVNFRFLRSLARWGKPTYVVVNQIDKHREDQLSFPEFERSLRQALKQWDIEPAGVLFLSMREKDHPLSQWEEMNRMLRDLQPLAAPLMIRSAERSAIYLAEQFKETLRASDREERERLQRTVGEQSDAQRAEARASLIAGLDEARRAGDVRREKFRHELDRLLGNANLTPAETREKAQRVLEAMQPGFKAGWLSGAAKTEAERDRRLTLLTNDFSGQISGHLVGHLRELLRQEAKSAGAEGASFEQTLDAAFAPVGGDWLKSLVKPGAGADGQATLHYSAEISAELKSLYRKAALGVFDELEAGRSSERDEAVAAVQLQLAELDDRDAAASEIEKLEASAREQERRLLEALPASPANDTIALPVPASISASRMEAMAASAETAHSAVSMAVPRAGANAAAETAGEQTPSAGDPQGAADLLERAAAQLRRLPALSAMADGLSAKAARFRDKRFTIALFGAFSAGKSSFANVLVGQSVLPVSPNPTTSAINRILAPSDGETAGSARITMKSKEAFAEDIRLSLRRIGIDRSELGAAGDNIERMLALKARISADELHPRGRPHLAFLNAAETGWSEYGKLLGSSFVAGEETYRMYAAAEQAACYVAEIDLYIDSPLTRSGAVLVDTPGADSINARHTGVAFQYIKNADAVLFVTYYNHAFTEADREFLNQLGSVKDVFELDKMFFVINASDLASSEAELASVCDHVETQLSKHGIRGARLFPVSSLLGIQAKQRGDREALARSGVAAFEQAFQTFSEQELGGLALAAARKELDRVDKLLESWLRSANADAGTREAKARRLQLEAESWIAQGEAMLPPAAAQPLLQEAGEQLYHLRQRVRFRFNAHFQSAFHPSVLQDDGRDLKKLLVACYGDLQRAIGEDLLQELRSAGLRLEGALNGIIDNVIQTKASAGGMAEEGFTPEPARRAALELPLYEPFANGPFADAKRLWNAFRSPKAFFEKDGKTALRDELLTELFQEIDRRFEELKAQWESALSDALRQALRAASRELAGQLAAFASSLSQSLLEPGEEQLLAEVLGEWRHIRQ
ncbi:dynamin family protein [Cohnella panacarvi]|uniref:dynamin family protein n=1 Tax=Cohnella panacarvi TaxID=400776 RepID=UPI00047B4A3B|nr:dynamin family protein [Cohnella panacarvi]